MWCLSDCFGTHDDIMATIGNENISEDEQKVHVDDLLPATESNKEHSLRIVMGKIISDKPFNKMMRRLLC